MKTEPARLRCCWRGGMARSHPALCRLPLPAPTASDLRCRAATAYSRKSSAFQAVGRAVPSVTRISISAPDVPVTLAWIRVSEVPEA